MSLFLRSPRTSQPQSSADVDWSSPLAGGAKLLVSGAEQRNLVSGKRPDVQAGLRQLYTGQEGVFDSAYSGASTGLSDDQYSIPATTDFALLARVDHSGSSGNLAAILGGDGTGNRQFQLRFTAANTVEFIRFNTAVGNVSCSVPAASRRGTVLAVSIGNSIYLYFGGASASATITGTPQPLTRISIGGGFGFDAFTYATDRLYMAAVLQGASVKSASASLIGNPWQLFKPQARSPWIPGTVSGGGSSHLLTGANSTQSSTSGTGAVSQSHLLTGASCSQSATSGTGAITQGATHILTGANSTQAALSGTGVITQGHMLVGAVATQAASSGTGAITQRHLLTGAGSSQTAASGTGAIIAGAVHVLAAANASQSATSSAAAITQGHVLISAPSVQDSIASASAIVQRHMLASAACSQAAVSGVGAITSTAPGTAVYPLAADVRAGVTYGPTGADYVGTLTGGSGPSAADIAAAVWSYTQ